MEIRWEVIIIILGAAIVTALPRVLPLVLLSKVSLSSKVQKWLRYIPIAVLSALLTQTLVLQQGESAEWIAAAVSLGVAYLTRSLLWTVVTGIVVIMCLRL
ncbi:AzlD domain-containing protein [Ectobacillus antri]|jgi:branched-subunit amino acid transport protein|uniref:AzlD domain-containing protein n=1 Tax=Ectobacillus antri TaxID=2486280 RepID=A0ABT6H2I0_9BACI|nr:AzlD domain-containing protein [Ectobacillus antri]MDG4656269.1 AzlD domain-containing protein [Ectobacillus antri]MDG5752944.1 AzlD domain-containing protein [Ectobacillus antri]